VSLQRNDQQQNENESTRYGAMGLSSITQTRRKKK